MKYYIPDEKEKIIKEYLNNKITIVNQASLYNVNTVTLHKWIKMYKIYRKKGLYRITPDQITIRELENKL